MGLFEFMKRKPEKPDETQKEKYWSLTTNEKEIKNPTIEQIEHAVKIATPTQTVFATLSYNYSGLEIESVQTISEEGFYRFESLTTDGKIYVKSDLSDKETVDLFTHFFNYKRVSGFRSWSMETY